MSTQKKNKFTLSMFDKLKDTLKKSESSGGGSFGNIMKFPKGHTYTIRLIPNVDNIDDSFFHHFTNSFKSRKTGNFVSALSLKTFGQNDPLDNLYWALYNEWKTANPNPPLGADGKKIKFNNPIDNKEQWLWNAYWVDNPAEPERNGTVQILRVGPQLNEKIQEAMTGERADEFGAAIFDLTKDGADFKIKAEEQGEFTTFKNSYFTAKSKLDLSDDEIEKIYESVFDLKAIYPVKTEAELVTLVEEHFFCGSEKKEVRKPLTRQTAPVVVDEEDVNDDIPFEWEETAPVVEEAPKSSPKAKAKPKASVEEDEVDAMLAELEAE